MLEKFHDYMDLWPVILTRLVLEPRYPLDFNSQWSLYRLFQSFPHVSTAMQFWCLRGSLLSVANLWAISKFLFLNTHALHTVSVSWGFQWHVHQTLHPHTDWEQFFTWIRWCLLLLICCSYHSHLCLYSHTSKRINSLACCYTFCSP